MKRVLKVWLCLVLFVGIGVVITNPISAATKNRIKIKSLASGKVASGNNYYYNPNGWTAYKIIVKKAGYITITSKKTSRKVTIYTSRPEYDESKSTITVEGEDIDKYYPVVKGTYYLFTDYSFESDAASYNFKYTFTAAPISTKNGCRATASPIKAKQVVTICTPYGYEMPHWYKLVLKDKQRLKITFNDLLNDDTEFSVYDSKLEEITMVHGDGSNYASFNKLAKGTYYIYVPGHFYSYLPYNLRLCKLSWK